MSSTVGDIGVTAMLESLDRDQRHTAIARFFQHEIGAEREKVALLHQQGPQQAEQLREIGDQHTELLIQHQLNAVLGGTTRVRRPEILKVDISKYRKVEEDSLGNRSSN